MPQDARLRRLSILLLAAFGTIGCQSPPKPPPQNFTPYNPTTPPTAAKPVGSTLSTTPSQPPVVNGASLNAAPPVTLPTAPGRSNPQINVPTIPGASSSNAPLPDRGQSVLPPAPPEVSGIVAPPVSSPVMMPTSLH